MTRRRRSGWTMFRKVQKLRQGPLRAGPPATLPLRPQALRLPEWSEGAAELDRPQALSGPWPERLSVWPSTESGVRSGASDEQQSAVTGIIRLATVIPGVPAC